jgi:hypothetical protein
MTTTSELLPQLRHAIETRFPAIGQPTRNELSVTGQPYVELITDVDSRAEADAAGLRLFEAYAARRMGTLYWRTPPMLERGRNGRKHTYRVRMALLISDNPIVQRLAAEALAEDAAGVAALPGAARR